MQRGVKSKNPNAVHFPIFSHEDYDFQFSAPPYPIGLKSTYPEELIRRVAAALISFQMHNSGLDYTYKRYLKEKRYEVNDGSRLDLKITKAISQRMKVLDELIFRATKLERKRLGEIVCEWTFLRIPFSIQLVVSCANRGAFFEAVAIARMVLEQIAWASKIDQYDDEKIIRKESASKAIGWLGKSRPVVGRFYGWLSTHAHWTYEGHIKAWRIEEDGSLSALLATPELKARSLALSILLAEIAENAFMNLKGKKISDGSSADVKFDRFKFDSEDPFYLEKRMTFEQLKNLLLASTFPELANEMTSVCPEDMDVNELAKMTLAAA